jgi:hypothetical protein
MNNIKDGSERWGGEVRTLSIRIRAKWRILVKAVINLCVP